jgi:hypothetical protein
VDTSHARSEWAARALPSTVATRTWRLGVDPAASIVRFYVWVLGSTPTAVSCRKGGTLVRMEYAATFLLSGHSHATCHSNRVRVGSLCPHRQVNMPEMLGLPPGPSVSRSRH